MAGIQRYPTVEELRDFIPISQPGGKVKNAEQKFNDQIAIEVEKAMKNGLPFCDKAARDEWKDYFDRITKDHMRKYGYVRIDEVKMPEVDWKKYSDLNNFELIEEGTTLDANLTKRHHDISIEIRFKKYKYKGYDKDTYVVMEDPNQAVQRVYDEIERKRIEGIRAPKK